MIQRAGSKQYAACSMTYYRHTAKAHTRVTLGSTEHAPSQEPFFSVTWAENFESEQL